MMHNPTLQTNWKAFLLPVHLYVGAGERREARNTGIEQSFLYVKLDWNILGISHSLVCINLEV